MCSSDLVWMWWGTKLPASCAPDYAVRLDPTEDGRRPNMDDALEAWNERRRPDQGVEAGKGAYNLSYNMDGSDPLVTNNPYFDANIASEKLVQSMGVDTTDNTLMMKEPSTESPQHELRQRTAHQSAPESDFKQS